WRVGAQGELAVQSLFRFGQPRRVFLSNPLRHAAARSVAPPRGSMYAVIETGGKQYRVEVGTELEIELLEAAPGDAVAFDRVLLVADGDAASIGRPVVPNASVSAETLP